MTFVRRHGFGFVLGILAGCLAMRSVYAQSRTGKTVTLLTTDLAGWCDGKEVTVELNEFGPGTSGKHYHPGHSFTWILEGSETYAVEGKPSKTVKSGEVLHEELNKSTPSITTRRSSCSYSASSKRRNQGLTGSPRHPADLDAVGPSCGR